MGADVNLTRHLTRIVTWKHVKDIELYDTVGTNQKFAYCSGTGTIRCTLEKGMKSPPRFQNRLKEKYYSILLTGVQEDDEGLDMRVNIHFTESVPRAFILRIRLDAPQGEFFFQTISAFSSKSDKVVKIRITNRNTIVASFLLP